MNDPRVIAKLLRAIAGSEDARAIKHDIIFNAAADLLEDDKVTPAMMSAAEVHAFWYPKDFAGIYRAMRKAKFRS